TTSSTTTVRRAPGPVTRDRAFCGRSQSRAWASRQSSRLEVIARRLGCQGPHGVAVSEPLRFFSRVRRGRGFAVEVGAQRGAGAGAAPRRHVRKTDVRDPVGLARSTEGGTG